MNFQTSVTDRAMESEQGGGPEAPDTDQTTIQQQINRFPNPGLKKAIVDAKRLIERTHAELALLVSEFHDRALAELDHGISTVRWLEKHCSMSPTEASGTLKTARALEHMPTVTDNALCGDVPWPSLRLLSEARDRYPQEFEHHEHVFADTATYLSTRDLRRAVGHWEQQVNYDQALGDARSVDQLRSFHHSQTYDGLWASKGTFSPEGGHIIDTALNAICDPSNLNGDGRSPTQRRADAVVELSRFWLDHNADAVTSGGEKPHITVTLDYRILTGALRQLPEIGGTAVDPETIRRLTCDAAIIPMVLGSDSEPLDVGRRTRTIPAALRRALEHRDGGCRWDGCTAPVSWCDAHHKIHWANGGRTSLANTMLLCRSHHTATHGQNRAPPDV